ncbi:hypothetical protein I3842_14G025900 [Carya illinoinensis]|uniref:Uncharacterized protein n=1 Tax=Carya illinoinensis TaxID=32201 RepID=A0A922A9P1_CARIL|nr:hypothetical protein I3842_14G025900 [Carya illinoinensis]
MNQNINHCLIVYTNLRIYVYQHECKELIIDIPLALEASRWPDECCIYRVPKRLRVVNNMAYTPMLVSIGPYHHRSEELKDMDIQKLIYLRDFCNRTGKSIEDLACIIEHKEIKIRRCYSENFLLSSEGFHDLLLLENQLPFFLLEELYRINELNSPSSLVKNGNNIVAIYRTHTQAHQTPTSLTRAQEGSEMQKEVKHLTDLVRYFFCSPKIEEQKSEPKCCTCCPPNRKQEDEIRRTKHLYGTATKLNEAGLKFTTPDSKTYLLDIKFRPNECLERFPCFNLSWLLSCLPCVKSHCLERRMQRCLEVPPLWVDDKTEGLFRNLMALEQCHYPYETYVCDYIVLLDDLITTKEDVRLLVEKKIIVNELGSSVAVTKLVNNLALEIEESGKLYSDLCTDLNTYYENIWNRLVGTLTRVYFTRLF